ncbi:uncharacterized protein LOC124310060 isoform X2 [Neodiprion virginianus]|uniref:uncharacterized protein LOC124310060 isoform X2 n=1 Tax=Neodiprion virginianus TaxID=2961670 RepID=UPI001EE760E3|nr:uncharacterized protein LOC124310060 isoform X2 [Neodiprion virginianus]XP_046629583.1 uncharacterized protein LOC124310060 isoform X2 [Neodiprion virginianus]XP_046629584.1 uncharacterized protein LOC124310060 isoform X2 [Neodiprion virginianus]XP_046629585.1 uncharacterized protein LOC124310060 isoform X2 [Neodiprion virginianus]XP_046629586.1 uncharacterized protein LOC124310060 isoform X2 [Neodiprion virginianus]XP_046629587.1 uncharacterized protein LOC124310060 isoform X2 [Neodiprion 
MAKLKQPTPLHKMVLNLLIKIVIDYFVKLSSVGSLDDLRRGVAAVKKEICSHIPRESSAEFHNRIIETLPYNSGEFHTVTWIFFPESYLNAVLEIVMDVEIPGLKCEGLIVAGLNPRDAHRLDGLTVLNLSSYLERIPTSFGRFRLQNLTTFVHREHCTDVDLIVVGRDCPKLETLDVTDSEKVSDRGLQALGQCSKLRTVRVALCRVTNRGIKKLLSDHRNIERLAAWPDNGYDGFNCFSNSDSTKFSSIINFNVLMKRIRTTHLNTIADKFPSLTFLGIHGCLVTGYLDPLLSFGKLSKLDFRAATGWNWPNLIQVLAVIGANVTELKTASNREDSKPESFVSQSDLDRVFEYCENVEWLSFDYLLEKDGEELVVPPFPRMMHFHGHVERKHHVTYKALLIFGAMLKLEELLMNGFYITADFIESIILDNARFPNLTKIMVPVISGFNKGYGDIRRIAKENNLDFRITGVL